MPILFFILTLISVKMTVFTAGDRRPKAGIRSRSVIFAFDFLARRLPRVWDETEDGVG